MYEIYWVKTPKSSQSLPGTSSKGGLMLEGIWQDAAVEEMAFVYSHMKRKTWKQQQQPQEEPNGYWILLIAKSHLR